MDKKDECEDEGKSAFAFSKTKARSFLNERSQDSDGARVAVWSLYFVYWRLT